ncbi:hypothetical protein GCM10009792_14460 [Microcella alkalica]
MDEPCLVEVAGDDVPLAPGGEAALDELAEDGGDLPSHDVEERPLVDEPTRAPRRDVASADEDDAPTGELDAEHRGHAVTARAMWTTPSMTRVA